MTTPTTATPPVPSGQPNAVQRAVTGAQNLGSTVGTTASNVFTGFGNWVRERYNNGTGWELAGMAAGGMLAWVIGNAFGGGGILGMVISAFLALGMIEGGRQLFSGFNSDAPRQSNGRVSQQAPSRVQAQQPQRAPSTRTSSLAEAPEYMLAEARDAVAPIHATELAGGALPHARAAEQRQLG